MMKRSKSPQPPLVPTKVGTQGRPRGVYGSAASSQRSKLRRSWIPTFVGMSGVVVALVAALATAQPRNTPRTFTQDDLKTAEAARDAALARVKALEARAGAAARDLSTIDADLIAAAAEAVGGEEAAYAAEEQLMILAHESRTAQEELVTDQAVMEDLFAALMTMRRPPALAANPEDVSKAIRAAILMSDTAPALAGRANDLRAQIENIENLAGATRAQQANLLAATSSAGARREEIIALAEEKRRASASLNAETAAARASAKKLADEAESLRELLEGLAKSAPPAPSVKPGQKPAVKPAATATKPATKPPAAAPSKPAATAKAGAPLYPVVGSPLRRFGRVIAGEKQEGLTLSARPGATVIAPMDARVQYSGLFRTYGQMVILDVGGDVLLVVSGMETLYPEAGQWVLAGEPVGRMADQKSPSPELYLEVRSKGQPVDPEAWLGKRG
jgi:septal ring factor EnvC (AmiA/AmiB activator)